MGLTVEKCLQAWTNSLKQMNAKANIVFFGDSLTYYGDFSSVFPDKAVCNLGLRGDTIRGMIDRVEQVKILEPQVMFLMAGINDVANTTPEFFGDSYIELVNTIMHQLTKTELVVQSMTPINTSSFKVSCDNYQIKNCNARIEQIANVQGLRFLDLYTLYEEKGELPLSYTIDGIHLLPHAYSQWYNELIK